MAVITSTDADFNKILADNKIVIVKYQADWCGSCKLFAPKFNRVSNEEEMSDVVFVDINAENNPEARKIAAVDNLPFLAIFKDGKLQEGSATSKEEYLRKMIENAKNS